MSDANKDLEEVARTATEDFYELLGISFDAPEPEVKRAYRKTSIKYHPDKNPNDAIAAEKFIRLGIVRDILLDAKLKEQYDRARSRRKEKALQDELLDGRRRKLKEDLERRERAGMATAANLKRKRAEDMSEREKKEAEIQRLAEDGKRRRKEQQERMKRRKQEEEEANAVDKTIEVGVKIPAPGETAEIDRTIKVRFERAGEMVLWDKDKISSMFGKYGKVDSVVIVKDKKVRLSGEKHRKTTATVFIVYTRVDHAYVAVAEATSDYPTIESATWASKEPELKSPVNGDFSAPSTPAATPNKNLRASFNANIAKGSYNTPGTPSFSFSPKTPSLEEVTMMRLKQAEKRKLEEQIRKQEAAEEAVA